MNKEELEKLLNQQQLVVISTIDQEGNPHSSTMFFSIDENLNFFLLTKANTRKYANIKINKKVALNVIFTDQQKTVQVEGEIEELANGTEAYHNVILNLSEKNAKQSGISWPPPVAKMPDDRIIVLKLKPLWLRYCDYSNPQDEVTVQIIPS